MALPPNPFHADEVTAPGTRLPETAEAGSTVAGLIEELVRPQRRTHLVQELGSVLKDRHQQLGAVLIFQAQLGEGVTPQSWTRHNGLLLAELDRCDGRLLLGARTTGVALFSSAHKAVDAAVAMLQAFGLGRTTPGLQAQQPEEVRLGIAVHLATLRGAGDDGGALQLALETTARVHRFAGPMQLLLTDPVRTQLPATLPVSHVGEVPPMGPLPAITLHEVSWRELRRVDEDLPRIDPRYLVQGKLGVGGMATVWRARDERLGREVAIKVLHRNLPFSSSMKERLQREARVAAALTHENIIQVYDVVAADQGDSYIAMEMVEGRSLRDYVERLGAVASFPATLIAYEVARGVGFAHARGVVHRDIKPDNVLISDRGAVKVGDFGIAVMDELVRLTATGVPVGTPAYLSPEQVKGERADVRSDVFAYGVMLYEIATGKLPFDGASSSAVMYKIVEGSYVAPETLAQLEPELVQVIRRCLRRDPAQRFQNISEVVEVLRPVLQRWSVMDPRATLAAYVTEGNLLRASSPDAVADRVPTVTTPRWRGRRSRALAFVAAPLLAVAVGGAVTYGLLSRSPELVPAPALVEAPRASVTPPAPPQEVRQRPPVVAATPVVPEPRPAARTRVRAATAQRSPQPPEVQPAVALAPGTLHLVVQGAWADILVDGKPRGRSPPVRDLTLPAGEHVIELRNPHRAPFRHSLTLAAGEEQVLRAELQPL